MAHVREQIRKAIVTALAGLTTTGANVFDARALPLGSTTPALCVYAAEEVADYDAGHGGATPMRLISLIVQGYHKGADDNMLDQIAAEVETALYVDETLGGLAQYTRILSQSLSREAESEKETGVIILNFEVAYLAAEGAPEVAI